MKKFVGLVLGGLLGLFTFAPAQAQIDGVSFSVSPHASYNWWNQNIGLKNSPFYGLRLGVGFGPYVELRATAEKSLNLKQSLEGKSWNILNEQALSKLEGMQFDVTRVGGELKFNILNSRFAVSPYLVVGGGVQLLDYNPYDAGKNLFEEAKQKEKQIYLTGGVGVNFNLSERVAFSLEGRNIQFNLSEANYLLNHNVDDKTKRWGNWSAIASLDITVGGTSRYNDKTMKYSNLFEDGFRGAKFVLEPGLLYADFSEKMGQQDQWFLGGSAGLDFSSLVGIRAFYYQATQDPQKLSFNFNKDLKMYGANLLLRLNQPRGIVPYLTLGAGYLDDKSLIPTDPDAPQPLPEPSERFDEHNLFLMGGAGVEVPFSRYIALFGNVNALVSSGNSKVINTKVDDIYTSLAYTAGLRFNIGVPAYEPMEATKEYNDVNDRVNETRSAADDEKMSEGVAPRRYLFQREEVMRQCHNKMMTKKEFEEMVDRILVKVRSEEMSRASKFSQSEMDIIVAALNAQNAQNGKVATVTTQDLTNQQLINEMRRLVDRVDQQQRTNTVQAAPVAPVQRVSPVVAPVAPVASSNNHSGNVSPSVVKNDFLKLNRLAAVTGVNFGQGTQWALGIRGYMQISSTDLDFVPELMVGFGNKSSFDLSGNVIYNIRLKNSVVDPYVGLGLGLYSHGLGLKFGSNIIVGANFKLNSKGELFADYIARGLFKNNQVAVGYRFVF